MKTIKGVVRTNKVGSECEFEFEIHENATEQEIELWAKEAAFDLVDWSYEEVEND